MNIALSWPEIQTAATAGVRRQIMNLHKGRRDNYGFSGDGWGVHVEGCIAEMAVAKALNQYWEPVVTGDPTKIKADVGDKIQVRYRGKPGWSLIVHPSDMDDAPFVLVVAPEGLPTLRLVGWILGRDAKRDEWWSDPSGKNRPAYFVPQEALRTDWEALKSTLSST